MLNLTKATFGQDWLCWGILRGTMIWLDFWWAYVVLAQRRFSFSWCAATFHMLIFYLNVSSEISRHFMAWYYRLVWFPYNTGTSIRLKSARSFFFLLGGLSILFSISVLHTILRTRKTENKAGKKQNIKYVRHVSAVVRFQVRC